MRTNGWTVDDMSRRLDSLEAAIAENSGKGSAGGK